MSINMDTDGPTDYSDFEYQQLDFQVTSDNPDGGDGNVAGLGSFGPLSDIGGLANNEVAELVYLETYAGLEEEPETDAGGAPDYIEFRGTVGANLSANTTSGISTTSGPPSQTTNIEITPDEGYSDNEVLESGPGDNIQGREVTRDEIFQLFRTASGGATSGASGDHFYAVKNWRQLTGRGPVLDNNDDMSVYGALIPGEDTSQQIRGNVRLHMVWDTAETSDAGRQFSVPR